MRLAALVSLIKGLGPSSIESQGFFRKKTFETFSKFGAVERLDLFAAAWHLVACDSSKSLGSIWRPQGMFTYVTEPFFSLNVTVTQDRGS